MEYDVIIIGGGPAGLSAAIYSSRRGMKTLVATRDIGGQITKTSGIENYPGFEHVTGTELAMKFYTQAKKFGSEFIFDQIKSIDKQENGDFLVKTNRNSFIAESIILSFGKSPRELGVPGEEKFKGKGVSYCATCDAPFFKGKTVAIVGGGNSALDAALVSASLADKVYLIHRSEFRGEEILIEKVKKAENITQVVPDEIIEIKGESKVDSIVLKDKGELKVDGVIVEVGFTIDRSMIENLVKIDEGGQVIIDRMQMTSVAGIFAAGDITETPFKQIVIAAGEGAKAALAAFDYVQKKGGGKKGPAVDWH